MAPTDPVERAARIIAAVEDDGISWDDEMAAWLQDLHRKAARAVLDDLAARTPTAGES